MSQKAHREEPKDIAARAEELLHELNESTFLPPSLPLKTSESGIKNVQDKRLQGTPPSPELSASLSPLTTSVKSGIPALFFLGSLAAFVVIALGLSSLNQTRKSINNSSPEKLDLFNRPSKNPAPKPKRNLNTNKSDAPAVAETQINEASRLEEPIQPKEDNSNKPSDSNPSEPGMSSCTFRSYRDSKSKSLSCLTSISTNINGHTVYNVQWEDGYSSRYVFWTNGMVEIFSKDGQGKPDREAGQFTSTPEGVELVSSLGSVTFLEGIDPIMN